jgi:hypothetical protein
MTKAAVMDERVRDALRSAHLEPEELLHVMREGFDFVAWAREEWDALAMAELLAAASDGLSARLN